ESTLLAPCFQSLPTLRNRFGGSDVRGRITLDGRLARLARQQREIFRRAKECRRLVHVAVLAGPPMHTSADEGMQLAHPHDTLPIRLLVVTVRRAAESLFEVIAEHGTAQFFGLECRLPRR